MRTINVFQLVVVLFLWCSWGHGIFSSSSKKKKNGQKKMPHTEVAAVELAAVNCNLSKKIETMSLFEVIAKMTLLDSLWALLTTYTHAIINVDNRPERRNINHIWNHLHMTYHVYNKLFSIYCNSHDGFAALQKNFRFCCSIERRHFSLWKEIAWEKQAAKFEYLIFLSIASSRAVMM